MGIEGAPSGAAPRELLLETGGASPQPTFVARNFRYMGPGSLRGTALNLSASAIGAGGLALPYAFGVSGIVVGMVSFIISALLIYYSSELLLRTAGPARTWPDYLARTIGGPRRTMDLILFLLCTGVITMYLVVVGNQCSAMLEGVERGESVSRVYYIIAAAMFVFPLSLPKLEFLRYVSLVVVVVMAAIGVCLPILGAGCDVPGVSGLPLWPRSALDAMQGFFIMVFCDMIHINFFGTFEAMADPPVWSPHRASPKADADNERMRKASRLAVLATSLVNVLIALGGALTLGTSATQDVLQRYRADECREWAFGIATGLRLLICIATLGSIAINLSPLRASFLALAGLQDRVTEATPAKWATVTMVLLAVCTGIASSTTRVADIVGIIGGTLCSTIIFLVPSLAYANLGLDTGSVRRWFTLLVFFVAALLGYGNVIAKLVVKQ